MVPKELLPAHPWWGAEKACFLLGALSHFSATGHKGIWPIWGESSSLWRLESFWLNFRDDKLLCFSCGRSNIHTCIEEQPQLFLSLLWWYQRKKNPTWIWSKIFPFPSLLASPCIQILEECTIWNSTRFSLAKSLQGKRGRRYLWKIKCKDLDFGMLHHACPQWTCSHKGGSGLYSGGPRGNFEA